MTKMPVPAETMPVASPTTGDSQGSAPAGTRGLSGDSPRPA